MYKWTLLCIAIYLLGDPNLTYLSAVASGSDVGEMFISIVLSLFITPWVVFQIDG